MITGSGYSTNPYEVVWFCHLCGVSFVQTPGSGAHHCGGTGK